MTNGTQSNPANSRANVDDVAMACEFFVHGIPLTQGSKTPFGGEHHGKALKDWRDDVATMALAVRGVHWRPQLGERYPVRLTCVFTVARPDSHMADSTVEIDGVQRRAFGKKAFPRPLAKPDLDKLQRAVGDAISKDVLVHDDAEIVEWRPFKVYARDGISGVFIRAERLFVGHLPSDVQAMILRQGFEFHRVDVVKKGTRPCTP